MANFCTNCGAAVNPGAPFCTQCGSRVAQAAAPAASPAPTPQPPPVQVQMQSAPATLAPASSSPLLKILLFVVLGLFVLGGLGLAGLFYAGYKVKHRVEQAAREYGVDPSSPTGPSAHRVDVCSLLTREEASEIIGTPVERVELTGSSECRYTGKPLTGEEREKAIEDARRNLEKSKGDQPDMQAAENMTKNMLGGMAGGVGPSFSVKVDWEGGHIAVKAMKLTASVLTGSSKLTESLQGIGDEAVMGPMNSMLICAKGDTAVTVDLRMLPNGKERGIEIAKRVVSRLQF